MPRKKSERTDGRPQPLTIRAWDYREVIQYVQKKYPMASWSDFAKDACPFDTDDGGDLDTPLIEFWNYLLGEYRIVPESIQTIHLEDPNISPWVQQILGHIKEEFCPKGNEMKLYFDW